MMLMRSPRALMTSLAGLSASSELRTKLIHEEWLNAPRHAHIPCTTLTPETQRPDPNPASAP